MPSNKSLAVAGVVEKNRISSGTPFLLFLELRVKDPISMDETNRMFFVHNDEDVAFDGETYIATPFTIELVADSNGVPEVTLTIPDYKRMIMKYLDLYQGLVESEVIITGMLADDLTANPEIQENFRVIGSSSSEFSVSIKLGAESQLARLFPNRRQLRDRCAWRYKSAHENSPRFGGFPGLKSRGINFG